MKPETKSFLIRPRQWVILGVAMLLAAMMTAGCGQGLPPEIKKQAKAVPDQIDTTKKKIKELAGQYKGIVKASDFKLVAPFAEKENWTQKFDQADEELKRARSLFDKTLNPMVKKDKPEFAPQVKQEIERIEKVIEGALNTARFPAARYLKIRDTISGADQVQAKSRKDAEKISGLVAAAKSGPMAKALAQFPDMTEQITARFAPLSKLDSSARDNLTVVEKEFNRHTSGGTADYAALADASTAIFGGAGQAQAMEASFTKDIEQLYTSYTKILSDMKEELFVTIKRESWDENSDFYNPKFATFVRQVSPEIYQKLTDPGLDTIAAITAGFGNSRFSSQVGSTWKELNINPTEQWPGRNHNAASFWVEDTQERYFHKYIFEKDGETRDSDWEQVDESFYEANLTFLGMAILAKPYGTFEKDRLVQAAPPGMAYVGNSQYGQWKEDDNGDRFWSWYGRYAFFSTLFFFPPTYYYYNSWHGWNSKYRHSRPYYGKTKKGFQKYGTYGNYIKRSSKFQSTSFAKSGGFKSQASSVRGAGAGLRGGGPKGKGK